MIALDDYGRPGALPESVPARVAMLLGLGGAAKMDDLALADQVVMGFPVKAATRLAELISTAGGQVRVLSEPTLRRAKTTRKPLSREQSERVYELGRVLDAAARVFAGDPGMVARFLRRPNPVLDGRPPLDVARSSSAGAQAVINLLEEAEAGVAL